MPKKINLIYLWERAKRKINVLSFLFKNCLSRYLYIFAMSDIRGNKKETFHFIFRYLFFFSLVHHVDPGKCSDYPTQLFEILALIISRDPQRTHGFQSPDAATVFPSILTLTHFLFLSPPPTTPFDVAPGRWAQHCFFVALYSFLPFFFKL